MLNKLELMFTDLAFIDWVALVFATVLLAAAAASAVLAYATSKNRQLPSFQLSNLLPRVAQLTPSQRSARAPEHANVSMAAPLRTSTVGAHAAVEAASTAGEATVRGSSLLEETNPSSEDVTSAVAQRAAKLAGRPIPETPSSQPPLPSEALRHGSSLVMTFDRSATKLRVDDDVVEGFKARTPGFFEDPLGRHELRYWDGHRWTEYVKELGERFTDPL